MIDEEMLRWQRNVNGELDELRTLDRVEAAPVFNVRARGAHADGSTDDGPAIQAAHDAAPEGSILYFPVTTSSYHIATNVTFSKRIAVVGAEAMPTVNISGISSGYAFTFGSGSRRSLLHNIRFQDSTPRAQNVIDAQDHDLRVDKCIFVTPDTAIHIDDRNGLVVSQTTFSGCGTAGIHAEGTSNVIDVRECVALNFPITATAVINLEPGGTDWLHDVRIRSLWSELNASRTIRLNGRVSNLHMDGFWIEDGAAEPSQPRIDIVAQEDALGGASEIRNGFIVVNDSASTNKSAIDADTAAINLENIETQVAAGTTIASRVTIQLNDTAYAQLKNVTAIVGEEFHRASVPPVVVGGHAIDHDWPRQNFRDDLLAFGGWAQEQHTNIATDTSFVSGHNLTAGGTTAPTLTYDTNIGFYDDNSARVTFAAQNGGISNAWAQHTDTIGASAGDEIRISFWAKTNAGTTSGAVIAAIVGDSEGTIATLRTSLEGDFKRVFLRADAVAADTYRLYFWTKHIDSGLTLWIDDIQMEVGAGLREVGPYLPASASVTTEKGNMVSGLEVGHWKKRTSAPTSPVDGGVYYADGSSWNPGSGQGLYRYDGTSYNLLG